MEKVYFIGAGPGDPELITVKGQRLIKEADVIIYAGSLVPREVIDCHKEGALVYNRKTAFVHRLYVGSRYMLLLDGSCLLE